MKYTWFAKLTDELAKLGVQKGKCGINVIARVRDLWLDDQTPEDAARAVKNEFFPERA
jgi:hypothetical protein